MKVLIVDDNVDAVKGIRHFCDDVSWECIVVDFGDYKDKVNEFNPDVIVLDWKSDANDDDAGNEILDSIIQNNFRPIIIFSALEQAIPDISYTKNKSLVYRFSKSDETVVIKKLQDLKPYIDAIKETRNKMNEALIESTKVIHNFIELDMKPEAKVVKHMLNQRTSHFFNSEIFDGVKHPAWIQYEYPPVTEHFLVADILRKVNESTDFNKVGDFSDYAIMLTPSCDLAREKNIKVLIANGGQSPGEFNANCKLKTTENVMAGKGLDKLEKMKTSLSHGVINSKIAIPVLKNKIPNMCFDLKQIELISLQKIAKNEFEIVYTQHEYYRIASINSPYREHFVWAYMNVACRPGVPERDYIEWAKGMLEQ